MIDLRSHLGLSLVQQPAAPASGQADPAELARRELERLRAEITSRQSSSPDPFVPAPPDEDEDQPKASLDDVVADYCHRSLFRYVIEQWTHCSVTKSIRLELGFPSVGNLNLPDRGHIKAICDHIQGQLEDAAAKRADLTKVLRAENLVINCPPRSLKTIILALASAWAWIHWPWLQILYVSATPAMILETARIFRDAISSEWYQRLFVKGAWKIRDDQDALSSMGNTAGGARRGFGFKARILGSNADWLQVDDAHDMDDTQDSIKEACEHYDGNISSRMNDPRTGIRTAIMQRAAYGDFSAHVLGHGWFHLRMPMEFENRPECKCPQCALCENGTPNAFGWVDWRTEDGEVLHPRYTPEYLAERRLVLRARGYAGQMQQRPAPAGGAMVKLSDLRFWRDEGAPLVAERPEGCYLGAARTLPEMDVTIITGDLAGGKLTTKGDFNALVVVGRSGADYYLLEFWVKRAGFPEVQAKVRELNRRYPRAKKIIESAAAGISLVASLEREISGLVGQVAKGDKESRLESVLAYFEAGNFYLPDGRPGLDDLVLSLTSFPNAAHDDDVDAISLALDALSVVLAEEWPEVKAARERAEALARGEIVEVPGILSKLNALWLGTPLPGKPRDIQTGAVVVACQHEWLNGICRLCKFSPS